MELKAGYKQTDVGVIPEDWDAGRLEEYFSFISYGFTNPMPTAEHGIYLVTAADISNGRIQFDTARHTTEMAYRTLLTQKSKPKKNDILLTKDGSLGRLALVGEDVICINQSVAVIRPNDKVEPIFLKMLLESPTYQKKMLEDAGGSTIKHIYITIVNLMTIAAPKSRSEQRAIAAALSDVDALITALDRLIAKKRDIKQAAMQELLTGKKRLPGFSGEWVLKRLGDSSILKARIGWQGLTTAEYMDSGDYYLVTGTEFKDAYIDWSSCHFVDESRYKQDKNIQLKENDVLVTKDGTIGKVALITNLPKPATLNSGVFVIRPIDNAFHPEFFYYLLCSNALTEFLIQLSAGSTINHLYQKDFVSFTYKMPATIDEQTAIATILSDIDAEIDALEARLAKARQVKQGMMQELLTGHIRLMQGGKA